MEIEDVMKKPIVIVKDISLLDAAKLMTKNGIKYLLFVSEEKVLGILTLRDLAKHFGENISFSSAMTKKVITVRKNEKVQKAIDLMRDNGISVLPVEDRNGKLLGVIHANDILHEACDNEEFLVD